MATPRIDRRSEQPAYAQTSARVEPTHAGTGLLIVAHGAEHEWNARVRETVAQVRWRRGPVALAFLMGEDLSADWDAAVDSLVANGAGTVRQTVEPGIDSTTTQPHQ